MKTKNKKAPNHALRNTSHQGYNKSIDGNKMRKISSKLSHSPKLLISCFESLLSLPSHLLSQVPMHKLTLPCSLNSYMGWIKRRKEYPPSAKAEVPI